MLIDSFDEGISNASFLLCIALMMKNRFLNIKIINDELNQYQKKLPLLNNNILQIYEIYELQDDSNFQTFCNILDCISYVYSLKDFDQCNKNVNQEHNLKNINDQFYDGLGKDLL